MKNLREIWEAGGVRRYHTERLIGPGQTVAEHSWGVATLVALLWPEASTLLLRAALLHDIAERWTGDGAFTAKRRWPALKAALDRAEADVFAELGAGYELSAEDQARLKVADRLEMVLFIAEQRALGNITQRLKLETLAHEILRSPEAPPAARALAAEYFRLPEQERPFGFDPKEDV